VNERQHSKHIIDLDSIIRCKPKQEDMPVEQCLDLYVEANAFNKKDSPCFKCPQGQRLRSLIARS